MKLFSELFSSGLLAIKLHAMVQKCSDQKMNNLQKLQQHVVELASHVDQLHEVIFTDLDGVPILRCSIDSSAEMSIKTHFLASKALSAEKVRTLTIVPVSFNSIQYNVSLLDCIDLRKYV
ncbi:hypothetical protein T4A_10132 [Trichinella pseudospiralis]|uniref:Ragulator complex protein LAMTOR3 n=1 Tax=Trichinella pseudospiralis TaxID=6337 RepID=A0A0V1E808_TRIPS|nr:hypothetical protein T4A_10144 [Trichinella pseudospiralis]KRY69975.1 hypothetical protein T4A_10132 [Trichinella pseudospiralis]